MTAESQGVTVAATGPSTGRVAFGDFLLDLETLELFSGEEALSLPPQPARLLSLLVSHGGELVTRDQIREHLWEEGEHVDADASINFLVRRLRTTLGDDASNPLFIETLPRRGYRFKADVEHLEPPESREARTQVHRRRVRLIGAVAVVTLALWVLLGLRSQQEITEETQVRSRSERGPTVLLGSFDARTSNPDLDESLTVAWRMILERSREALVLLPSSAQEALERMRLDSDTVIDRDLGIELCVREGIDFLVLGRARSLGGRFLIGGEIVEAQSGETLLTVTEPIVDESQLLEGLEVVGRRLREHLGESRPAPAGSGQLDPVTTASLEGLEVYSEAIRARHGLNPPPEEELAELLRHATELDPEFGMAHAKLAAVYRNLGDLERAVEHFELAQSLSERLTRYESLYIDAWIATVSESRDCAQPWELLARLYPDDFTAAINAANAREMCSQDWEGALVHARRALEIPAGSEFFARNHVARVLLSLGDYEGALEEAVRVEEIGGHPTALGIWALTLTGREEDAGVAVASCLETCPSDTQLEILSQEPARLAYLGRLEDAWEMAARFEDAGSSQSRRDELFQVRARLNRAALGAATGRVSATAKALEELLGLLEGIPDDPALMPSRLMVPASLGALAALEVDLEDLARRLTDRAMPRGPEGVPANLVAYADLLEAAWHERDGEDAFAVADLERGLSRPLRPEHLRVPLAELMMKAGASGAAREQLEKLLELRPMALFQCLGLAGCYEETHSALAVRSAIDSLAVSALSGD